MTTVRTVETVLAEKRKQLAALGDGRDCRSETERESYWRTFTPLQRDITVLMNAPQDKAKLDLRIAPLQSALDKAQKAEATITQQIAELPDWRSITDRRERDKAWADEQALKASVKVLQSGCEYFNGIPALPMPLREALTEVCPHCGHGDLSWIGPIPTLVEQLAALQQKRTATQSQLDGAMQEREQVPT